MQIIFSKKEKRVLQLFKQLQSFHNELMSIDTEISFLNEYSTDEYVEKLSKMAQNCRNDITLTLNSINLISR